MITFDYKIALQIEIADRQGAIQEGLLAETWVRECMVVRHLQLAAETSADRLPALWEFWNSTNFGHETDNHAAAEAVAVLEYVLEEMGASPNEHWVRK